MKIKNFFLDQGETLGGAERFLLDFYQELTDNEIINLNCLIIGGTNPNYQKKIPIKIKHQDFNFPSLKGHWLKKICKSFTLLMAAKKLAKLIKKNTQNSNFNIFANTPRAILTAFLAKKIWRMSGTLIIMIHDFTIPAKLLRIIAKTSDKIIANSTITRQIIRSQIKKSDYKKIFIIENGINIEKIPAIKEIQTIEKVLIIGRIDPRKGQLFFVETADLLKERNPNLKFFMVGSSFAEDEKTIIYEKKIRQFVKNRQLNNVYFINETQEPFDVIKDADLLLFLPTQPETFGRVVIEGLAMNKIVLSFAETGPKQILESFIKFAKIRENLIIEKLNSMSLAEKVAFFADNPKIACEVSKKGREFVAKNFNLKETKKRLLNLLLSK